MSTACVYGDEESPEVVPCHNDLQTSTFTCPQPRSRSAATEVPAKPRELEMNVRFVREGGNEETRGTLVAKFDQMRFKREEAEEQDPLVDVRLNSNGSEASDERQESSVALPGPGRRRATTIKDKLIKRLSLTLLDVAGEFIGTFFLTLVICTAVASSVISGSLLGLWQVAVVCGLGVALSIYCTAYISGAHLNPAVTLSFAIVRRRVFSCGKIPSYITGQMLGGFCAGGVLYGLYRHAISEFESENGLERGKNGSELSAMVFGEYFPNPAVYSHTDSFHVVSPVEAMLIEAWATGILVFVIFSLTDQQNGTVGSGKHKVVVPALIGITVGILISLYAPLTQAGMNPARDFGPRLFSVLVGWGRIAIPGPRNGFWVYIVGPIIGGPIGGALYDWLVSMVVHFAALTRKRGIGRNEHPFPLHVQNN